MYKTEQIYNSLTEVLHLQNAAGSTKQGFYNRLYKLRTQTKRLRK